MSDLSKSVTVMAEAELERARLRWLEAPQAKRELVLSVLTNNSVDAAKMGHQAEGRGLGSLAAAYHDSESAFDAAHAVLDALQYLGKPLPSALAAPVQASVYGPGAEPPAPEDMHGAADGFGGTDDPEPE